MQGRGRSSGSLIEYGSIDVGLNCPNCRSIYSATPLPPRRRATSYWKMEIYWAPKTRETPLRRIEGLYFEITCTISTGLRTRISRSLRISLWVVGDVLDEEPLRIKHLFGATWWTFSRPEKRTWDCRGREELKQATSTANLQL